MKQQIKAPVIQFLSTPGNEKLSLDKALEKFSKLHGDTRKPAFKFYYDAFKNGEITLADLSQRGSDRVKIDYTKIKLTGFMPGKAKIDKGLFTPLATKKGIDKLLSVEGGVMQGTTIIVSGGAGVGKSTVSYDILAQLKRNYPNKKMACVQSEMKKIDLEFEYHKNNKSWMADVEFIVLKDIEAKDENGEVLKGYDILDSALSQIFHSGYDFLVIDSVEDIVSKLKDFCDMSAGQAENFMLGLFDSANDGIDNKGVHTAILAIQQVTKGDVQKGSNKLSHNTTGQLSLRIDELGNRYARFSKNRRGGMYVGKKMFYSLDSKGDVVWDIKLFEESEDRSKMLKAEKEKLQLGADTFATIFGKKNEYEIDRQGENAGEMHLSVLSGGEMLEGGDEDDNDD